MRRIADAVEYSPASLYLYFQNRDDIAAHLCAEGLRAFYEFLRTRVGSDEPIAQNHQFAQAYVAFAKAEPEAYRISLMVDHRYTDAVARATTPEVQEGIEAGLKVLDLGAQALRRLHAEGRLRDGADAALLAHVIWSGLHGMVSLHLTLPNFPLPSPELAATALVDSVLSGALREPGCLLSFGAALPTQTGEC